MRYHTASGQGINHTARSDAVSCSRLRVQLAHRFHVFAVQSALTGHSIAAMNLTLEVLVDGCLISCVAVRMVLVLNPAVAIHLQALP